MKKRIDDVKVFVRLSHDAIVAEKCYGKNYVHGNNLFVRASRTHIHHMPYIEVCDDVTAYFTNSFKRDLSIDEIIDEKKGNKISQKKSSSSS